MIEALKNTVFIVTERLERKELSPDFLNRYSNIPADYQEFLQRFQIIANESGAIVIMYGLTPLRTLMENLTVHSVGMNLN